MQLVTFALMTSLILRSQFSSWCEHSGSQKCYRDCEAKTSLIVTELMHSHYFSTERNWNLQIKNFAKTETCSTCAKWTDVQK